ncbi:MAG: AraC family transcriptional regulator, partial [Bacteroides sp.]|nr:AraC family transcriptional regulator [Bacteroides sp.]MBP7265367.1 AraC family transcriptional regulator [Bacteroides sp.]MBP8734601.1 AraC family transcriptional regulator [Bacteroides sp.]MBP9631355.1 AraC family transcriptional regulator [Bacteroides sp.]
EIAYEVGFSSPKRFTVNFKNEFGISPSDYIRSLK